MCRICVCVCFMYVKTVNSQSKYSYHYYYYYYFELSSKLSYRCDILQTRWFMSISHISYTFISPSIPISVRLFFSLPLFHGLCRIILHRRNVSTDHLNLFSPVFSAFLNALHLFIRLLFFFFPSTAQRYRFSYVLFTKNLKYKVRMPRI